MYSIYLCFTFAVWAFCVNLFLLPSCSGSSFHWSLFVVMIYALRFYDLSFVGDEWLLIGILFLLLRDLGFSVREMATVPGQLIWEIVKKNNSFLVKEFGNGTASVKFSKEPNNLCNIHSFKHSGWPLSLSRSPSPPVCMQSCQFWGFCEFIKLCS